MPKRQSTGVERIKHQWRKINGPRGAVLLLMNTYAKHKEQFAILTVKKIEVLKRIGSEMAALGCHFAPAELEKKMEQYENTVSFYKIIGFSVFECNIFPEI